jgi:hypothetical protein
MRLFFAFILLVIGGLLTVPANIAIWTRREVGNEDRFVQNVNNILTQDDVQTLLAQRMTTKIVQLTDLQTRIGNSLSEVPVPSGQTTDLTILEVPLTNAAEDRIYQVSLRVISSDAFIQIADTAVRATHKTVNAVIQHDNEYVTLQGDAIVLDLRPALEQIIERLGGNRGQELVQRLDIPEDAGQFVIIEKADQPTAWKVVNNLKYVNPWVPLAAIGCFGLALVAAKDRRKMLIWIGATVAVIAALSFTLLALPLKNLLTSWPPTSEGQAAARSSYEVLLRSFQVQNALLVVFGGLLAGTASLAGDRRLTRSLARVVRRDRHAELEESLSVTSWIREHVFAMRILGFGVGGVALLVWPNLSVRFVIEILLLLGLYLLAIEVTAGDADWAVRTRERLSEMFRRTKAQDRDASAEGGGLARWVGYRRRLLQILGIVVGIVVILVWPSLTSRLFITVIGLELLFLALIEIIASRAPRGP